MRHWPSLLLVFLVLGCESVSTPDASDAALEATLPRGDHLFQKPAQHTSAHAIHTLNPEQTTAFLSYFHSVDTHDTEPHKRVAGYLKTITKNFRYKGKTLTAEQVLTEMQGNCLSLAILTTALAQVAGVKVEYQLVESDPVFSFSDNAVVKGVHIRTRLLDDTIKAEPGHIFIQRPGILIDYFPDGSERFIDNVSRQDYVSRYYINQAVDAADASDLDLAYWLTIEALNHHPASEDAINNLAVIYKHAGHQELAEATYRYGLTNAKNPLSLMKNYRVLLLEQDREAEALALQTRIDRLNDPSPHHWYLTGLSAFNDGDYSEAIRYLKRAEAIAPYIHNIHFALAKTYYQMGKYSQSRHHLELAKENTHTPSLQELYEAKLETLAHNLSSL